MGIISNWLGRTPRPSYWDPGTRTYVTYYGPTVDEVMGMTVADLYRTQPNLRTVVSFRARQISQLGLHAFERVGDNDRRRVSGGALGALLDRPNLHQTMPKFIASVVAMKSLYDRVIITVTRTNDLPSGWALNVIPEEWVQRARGGTEFARAEYLIKPPGFQGEGVWWKREDLLIWDGWDPSDPAGHTSPVAALRDVLAEQIDAWVFRRQLWQKGGRIGAYLTRPKDAPVWSMEARDRFVERFKQQWTGNGGANAGGVPLLEDGIELKQARFNAREEQWSEVAKLSLQTCASVFHINPINVGMLDNANYSNMKEIRKSTYSDSLGPDIKELEALLNTFLLPRLLEEDHRVYLEFNVAEKLKGSFEEQASVMSTSTGGPWLTRNEARARQNLPAIEGGDELIVPLNVIAGGQASPQDGITGSDPTKTLQVVHLGLPSAEPKDREILRIKSGDVPNIDEYREQMQEVLTKFFTRQGRAVLAARGAKSPDWWDGDRWDRELADDLLEELYRVSGLVGRDQAEALVGDPNQYHPPRTYAYLKSMASKRAEYINSATLREIEELEDRDEDAEERTVSDVFEYAKDNRAVSASGAIVSAVAAFATVEAAKQSTGLQSTKTWIVTSSNPRPEHAAMNGETVSVAALFSNGAKWPGDAVLGPDGVSGCMCEIEIDVP